MSDGSLPADLDLIDPDLYVACLFVPARHRSHVGALMAFELEVERIAMQVNEPMVAQIRYAWWREQIDAIFEGRAVAAPVVRGLREAVLAHELPRAPLDAIIDAHSLDCDPTPFADMAAFEAYCRDTHASLMRLVVRVLGAGDRADMACDHAGLAFGAASQLRSFNYWWRHRRWSGAGGCICWARQGRTGLGAWLRPEADRSCASGAQWNAVSARCDAGIGACDGRSWRACAWLRPSIPAGAQSLGARYAHCPG